MIRFTEDTRLADLERRVSELETALRNVTRNAVTPVTRNADHNVTRNASNAERQRRYRERRAALKNKNSA